MRLLSPLVSYVLKLANEEVVTYLLALPPPHNLGAPHQPDQDRRNTLEPDLRTFCRSCGLRSPRSLFATLKEPSSSSLARPKYPQKSPDKNVKGCLIGGGPPHLYPLVPGTSPNDGFLALIC